MGLLSNADKVKYALTIGRIFEYVCDTPGCGKLILPGEMCTVLKWKKREDGLEAMLGRIPVKVRCNTCEYELHPPVIKEVKVKGAGRGAKKVTAEVASGLKIDPIVRKTTLRLLKASPGGLEMGLLIPRLMKKKAIRAMKKKDIVATIRSMRKLKMFKKKQNCFVLPKEKKIKQKKDKKK